MGFFKKRKDTFRKEKVLPMGTILIVTKNNQDEIQILMKHLIEHPLFKDPKGKIIFFDIYSYDNTLKIIEDYIIQYPSKIKLVKKTPRRSLSQLVDLYRSEQYIDYINLAKTSEIEELITVREFPIWIEKLRKVKTREKGTNRIDPKLVLERLELDRSYIYQILRKDVLESLANIEMQMKETKKSPNEVEDAIHLLNKTIGKIRGILLQFDPNIYEGEDLYLNLSSLLKDFTEKNQIPCSIIETGKSIKVKPNFGANIIRMIVYLLQFLMKYNFLQNVNIKLRWGTQLLTIIVYEESKLRYINKIDENDLLFVDERATLLGGQFRMKRLKNKSMEFIITIPIHQLKDDFHETTEQ